MKIRSAVVAGSVLALLAGCAGREPQVAVKPAPAPEAAPPAPAETETYSRLAGRKIKRIEAKPITVRADCSYKDPTGYGGRLELQVDDSQVRRLQAEVTVPGHGKCSFALKDFRQTTREPSVTLAAERGKCVVRMWEQEGRVTVAFNSCKDRCQADSFDYVWPILVDVRAGTCS